MPSPTRSSMQCDELSSPDPLASSPASIASIAYPKHGSSSSIRGQGVVRKSIENVSILPQSSPSKTVTEQTLSPWKIRVTVEAEPENEANIQLETVTRTTRVPLKYSSPPSQHRTSAGSKPAPRPRTGSVTANRRRSATPIAERRRKQSLTDLDIIVLGDDAEEDEWGRKQRKTSPKKSKPRTITGSDIENGAEQATTSVFEVRQDTDAEDATHMTDREESPELRQIDLNRVSVRARSNSTKTNTKYQIGYDDGQHEIRHVKPLPGMASSGKRTVSANSAMTYPTPSPTASERGHSVEVDDATDDTEDHPEGFDTIMESEGFTMIDLDSIPSVHRILSSPLEEQAKLSPLTSQGDSESSVRRLPVSSATTNPDKMLTSATAGPPRIMLPEDISEISSTLPSSPPSFIKQSQPLRENSNLSHLQVPAQARNRQVTPQAYSSPKLPSPPRQSATRERSTPDSVKAMRAALALQGAMEPAASVPIIPLRPNFRQSITREKQHSRAGSRELFEGFNAGTQRELRAGLRFGEELAKQQQLQSTVRTSTIALNRVADPQVWRGESVISRTPIQGQLGEDQGKEDVGITKKSLPSTLVSPPTSNSAQNILLLDNAARLKQDWRREREIVSRQMNEANPSQIVTIKSDSEGSSETSNQLQQARSSKDVEMHDSSGFDDGDIWLEEAKESSSSPRQESDSTSSSHIESQLQTTKPVKRGERSVGSHLSNSWRDGPQTGQANDSTIMTNADDMSGVLWREEDQDDVHFGAAAISNVRKQLNKSGVNGFNTRRTSGEFDIEKMLGTPKRIRESLAQEQAQRFLLETASGNSIPEPLEDRYCGSAEDEVSNEETPTESLYSNESEAATPKPVRLVPVNFNDSTVSQVQNTTPPFSGARFTDSPPIARPVTPRSAMKGSRQSFGAGLEGHEQTGRRVIFAERSRGVNIDWVEDSSTIQTSSEDSVDSPTVEHQRHHQQRQLLADSSPHIVCSDPDPRTNHLSTQEPTIASIEAQAHKPTQKGWLGWIWNPKSAQTTTEVISQIQVDGTSEESQPRSRPHAGNNVSSHENSTAESPQTEQRRTTTKPKSYLPSYLLAPSYPSDSTRSPNTPLSTSGSFTNTHFRTLHILHRKSQRPRFHAPILQTCRPEIRLLVTHRWKLNVDESSSGLGGFAWTVGETEACVLERFCREIEFGYLKRDVTDEEVGALSAEWSGMGGIWGGNIGHGAGVVRWGWKVEQLATWLGRIVVGEVVREEEFGGC